MIITTLKVFCPVPMRGRLMGRTYFAWLKWAVLWGE